MEDVNHINLVDANEQVYCHFTGQVDVFDGVHVAKLCWNCPFWGGLTPEGNGVSCVYDDPAATAASVKYTKPSAALAEAPERPEDLTTVSSQAGLAAFQARQAMVPAQPEGEAAVPEKEVSPEQAAPEETEEAPAETIPPKKKKGPVPPQFAKSITQVDLVAAMVKAMSPLAKHELIGEGHDHGEILDSDVEIVTGQEGEAEKETDDETEEVVDETNFSEKHLPGQHDQQSHAGGERELANQIVGKPRSLSEQVKDRFKVGDKVQRLEVLSVGNNGSLKVKFPNGSTGMVRGGAFLMESIFRDGKRIKGLEMVEVFDKNNKFLGHDTREKSSIGY